MSISHNINIVCAYSTNHYVSIRSNFINGSIHIINNWPTIVYTKYHRVTARSIDISNVKCCILVFSNRQITIAKIFFLSVRRTTQIFTNVYLLNITL